MNYLVSKVLSIRIVLRQSVLLFFQNFLRGKRSFQKKKKGVHGLGWGGVGGLFTTDFFTDYTVHYKISTKEKKRKTLGSDSSNIVVLITCQD